MSDPEAFELRFGENSDYTATVKFEPNDDICGEGYWGYDLEIIFDNSSWRSWLWNMPEERGDRADVEQSATEYYKEIVRLIQAVRS